MVGKAIELDRNDLMGWLTPTNILQARKLGRELSKDELYVTLRVGITDIESDAFKDALELAEEYRSEIQDGTHILLSKESYKVHKNPIEVIKVSKHCVVGRLIKEW